MFDPKEPDAEPSSVDPHADDTIHDAPDTEFEDDLDDNF